MWLAEAIAIGRIEAPYFGDDPLITKAWSNCDWFGPTNGLLDPIKEVQAAKLRIDYGFSTHEKETAEMTGTNYDDNVDILGLEKLKQAKAGLIEGGEQI